MKKLEKLTFEERRDFATLLNTWLFGYTDEVITKVMKKAEEIYNDAMTMKLLNEYHARYIKERNEAVSNFEFYIMEVSENSFEESLIHCNPLTHSKSYKDILHDLWIANI